MKKFLFYIFLLIYLNSYSQSKYEPVSFSEVIINDNFWKPKLDKVATKTLAACIYQTEIKTPRIRNYEKIVRNKGEKFEGIYYDDSDVYKALEAMGYSLKNKRDTALEATADRWIDIIAAAQMPDGYLFTFYQLGDFSKRWTSIPQHEDYCAGHLIEAAIAYYNATGKRKLLDVATRFADHIDSTFRLGNKPWFSGHQEIELALMKLYRLTKNDRYLKLADWYLQQRGKNYYTYGKNWITPDYWQDIVAVKDQKEITGHAVRAMYLYSGAADVAGVTGNKDYVSAMKRVWEDVVYRNMYITGGIGSAGDNEGFSKDYDLPNELAYCETCASVGMVFWNHRMNQLTGESKYIDILERSLYNGALDGLSLSGDRFFYDNPLASNGQHRRREWFGTACCPANISRLVASVGDYIFGKTDNSIWVNLFVGSETKINLGGNEVDFRMKTNYPLDGQVNFKVNPEKTAKFTLKIRIPGWLTGGFVPGGLYKIDSTSFVPYQARRVSINGIITNVEQENGYLIINREWKANDEVSVIFPMLINKINSRPEVKMNNNRIALQRGPLVYCVEGSDNDGEVWNIFVPVETRFTEFNYKVLNEDVVSLRAELPSTVPTADGKGVEIKKRIITAIPYYTWANREPGPMQVWLPTKIKNIKINYASKYEDGGNYIP